MATSRRYMVDQMLQLLEDSYGDVDLGDEYDLSDDPEFPYLTDSLYHDSDTNSGRYLHKHFTSKQTFLLLKC